MAADLQGIFAESKRRSQARRKAILENLQFKLKKEASQAEEQDNRKFAELQQRQKQQAADDQARQANQAQEPPRVQMGTETGGLESGRFGKTRSFANVHKNVKAASEGGRQEVGTAVAGDRGAGQTGIIPDILRKRGIDIAGPGTNQTIETGVAAPGTRGTQSSSTTVISEGPRKVGLRLGPFQFRVGDRRQDQTTTIHTTPDADFNRSNIDMISSAIRTENPETILGAFRNAEQVYGSNTEGFERAVILGKQQAAQEKVIFEENLPGEINDILLNFPEAPTEAIISILRLERRGDVLDAAEIRKSFGQSERQKLQQAEINAFNARAGASRSAARSSNATARKTQFELKQAERNADAFSDKTSAQARIAENNLQLKRVEAKEAELAHDARLDLSANRPLAETLGARNDGTAAIERELSIFSKQSGGTTSRTDNLAQFNKNVYGGPDGGIKEDQVPLHFANVRAGVGRGKLLIIIPREESSIFDGLKSFFGADTKRENRLREPELEMVAGLVGTVLDPASGKKEIKRAVEFLEDARLAFFLDERGALDKGFFGSDAELEAALGESGKGLFFAQDLGLERGGDNTEAARLLEAFVRFQDAVPEEASAAIGGANLRGRSAPGAPQVDAPKPVETQEETLIDRGLQRQEERRRRATNILSGSR